MSASPRGLSSFEAIILVTAVATGLVTTQVFMRRAAQGRLRTLADSVTEQQYLPGHTAGTETLHTESRREEFSITTSRGGNTEAGFNTLANVEETTRTTHNLTVNDHVDTTLFE